MSASPNPPDARIIGQGWSRPRGAPVDATETAPHGGWQHLAGYTTGGYDPGRGAFTRLLWYYVSLLVFEGGWLPASAPKRALLRLFGAKIGRGVVIKPQVRIKYPWRLCVGDHVWIGQQVWIDNLAQVTIGSHVCISQGAYLCTGSHDHRRLTFDLIVEPIEVADACWIGCFAVVLGGCRLPQNTVVVATTLLTPRDLRAASAD